MLPANLALGFGVWVCCFDFCFLASNVKGSAFWFRLSDLKGISFHKNIKAIGYGFGDLDSLQKHN